MNLLYYHSLNKGAPGTNSRSLFRSLLDIKEDIPFNIQLFSPTFDTTKLKQEYNGIEILTIKDLLMKSLEDTIVHIPVSPLLWPNSKFLLHFLTKLKKQKIIFTLRGEPRIETKYRFSFGYIPNYIATPFLLKKIDRIVVTSNKMLNLIETKYKLNNVVVIPNGIDSWWFFNKNKSK